MTHNRPSSQHTSVILSADFRRQQRKWLNERQTDASVKPVSGLSQQRKVTERNQLLFGELTQVNTDTEHETDLKPMYSGTLRHLSPEQQLTVVG